MIQFRNVSKSYDAGNTFVVKDLSLEIRGGETLVLLGSSGSGKTTLLKMILRLIEPTSGSIFFKQRNIVEYPIVKLRRSIGYVLQKANLFPHMSIEDNIAIVLRLKGVPLKERRARAHELLRLIDLDPASYAKRFPAELSGGQEQRVGVARALATDPKCLLMDEPFASLDAINRQALQDELLQLKAKIKKTIVFVTHDIQEALKLGDRIAVLHEGHLQQIGTKEDLIKTPKTPFVERLVHSSLDLSQ
ncbi:ABC transporter ATP-binding protein [Candidatus Nucleicultrix amoebiphila]|jgi:osmoprotectant transport system ATP-binding protein|uniref:Glycine/betaine ABC transporter ATP-binding protein n=1 Tax=Candidatus Nucleicultrix amoebiphila FS5 TaxID=1414854 RepID=A0A1W6N4C6_9PROT|nr:ATP-binding cassette domain-containing protein [Candidatus Nucleicultrix amoebiphila]ARN84730.1 glycine/betaine ABC transporter ATP-binding protein [Candidatus Nucleicultrix amoebiphila FS5]